MNININKDFAEAYRDELARGLTLREWVALGSAGIVGVGQILALHHFFGVNLIFGVYLAVPLCFGVLMLGIRRTQGLTMLQLWREKQYTRATRLLCYEAEELKEEPPLYSMEHPPKKQKNRKRRKRRNRNGSH